MDRIRSEILSAVDVPDRYTPQDVSADAEQLLQCAQDLAEKAKAGQHFHAEALAVLERAYRLVKIYGEPEDYHFEQPTEADQQPDPEPEQVQEGHFVIFGDEHVDEVDESWTPRRGRKLKGWAKAFESFAEAHIEISYADPDSKKVWHIGELVADGENYRARLLYTLDPTVEEL